MSYAYCKTGAALAVLAISALAAPAFAQQGAPAFSGVSPGLAQAPTEDITAGDLSAGFLYDSNIARSDREVAAERHLSLGDEVSNPSVDFTLARLLGQNVLFVEGNAGYDWHRIDTSLNRENVDVAGGLNAHFGGCQVLLTGGYSIMQEDLADESTVNTANAISTKNVTAATSCGQTIGFSPTATVSETWTDNSASQYAVVNSNTLSTTAGVAYRQPWLGTIILSGNYALTNFPNRPLPMVTDGQTVAYNDFGGGITYDGHLGERIEGIATFGYTVLEANSPLLSNFHGPTYSLSVFYHMNPRIIWHASSSRATLPSNRIDAVYSVNDVYQGDVTYLYTSRLNFVLTASNTSSTYRVIEYVPITDITHQVIDDVFLTANYLLTPRITLSFNVGDEERRANLPEYNYSSTRVGFTAKAAF
jgi:hypothetical protein